MGRFDAQVAVVAGGGTGIGLATARALAVEGAQVFIGGRNPERGAQAAQQIAEGGGQATFVRTDVTDDAQVAALAAQAAAERGRIDVWFNNAGIEGGAGPFPESDDSTLRQLLDTNVKGVYSGMRHAVQHMPDGGVIVNNASFVGTKVPVPVAVGYGGTKAAVVSMTRAAAAALHERGIDVFAVCPCIVDTPMVDRLKGGQGPAARAGFAAAMAPSGKLGTPEEVAMVVVGLCRRDSGHPSGEVLLVDAGPAVQPM